MRVCGSCSVVRLSWSLPLLVSAACSGSHTTQGNAARAVRVSSITIPFPGSGSGGQNQLLLAGFTPNSCSVAGPAATLDAGPIQVTPPDHVTCYYSSVSPGTPMAFLEQVVETAEGQGLVHVRLTMNPAFVDNTYGTTAIGWGGSDAGSGPPAGPAGPAAPAKPGGPGGPGAASMMGMGPGGGGPHGPGGHTFDDLVGSDHAEFDLSDAAGASVLSFDLDYISSDSSALSGYATLGVNGGDGKMLSGDATAIVYASTSLDRDLNACGYSSYTTNSPATDASYTPNASTPNWDYRAVYDVWVKADAFAGGFGRATIPYVHASPAKLNATLPVTPGPCPPPFDGCDGGECDDAGSTCVGEGCPGNDGCPGEGCNDAATPPIAR